MLFLSLIFSLLFAWATSYLAQQRGRDPIIWFLLGMLLGILGPVLVLILPDARSKDGKQQGPGQGPSTYSDADSKTIEVQPTEVYTVTPFHQHEWFYYDLEQIRQGPLSFEDLKRLWQETRVGGNTYVWHEGMGNWEKISEIPDLLAALNK